MILGYLTATLSNAMGEVVNICSIYIGITFNILLYKVVRVFHLKLKVSIINKLIGFFI